jgi:hypothetical protein
VPAPESGPVLAPERADALAPARAWWNRRPRGRTPWLAGLGVALVVVLALVGYLAAVAIGNAKYPPDQPVRALFDVCWRIDQAPVIEVVAADEPGPTDAPAAVRTVTPGRATVTYTAFTSAGGDRSTVTQQLPIEIAGTVDVDPAHPGRVIWNG